jgi:Ca-activated chloride channel family protein
MLTDLAVDIQLDGGATSRVYPRQMPDLFRGDQLVLVGRYRKGGAAKINLTGVAGAKKEAFSFPATFVETSHDESNGFVARLWAIRRIGEIIDELDLRGRNQELVDELVALSQKHGILTPYTSFLADDNVRLGALRENAAMASRFVADELSVTTGAGGFMQRDIKAQMQSAPRAMALPPPSRAKVRRRSSRSDRRRSSRRIRPGRIPR